MEAHARCSAGNRWSLDAVPDASHRHRTFAVWVLWVLALVLVTPVSATSYVYDASGRLIAVTNDAGESARYVYDVMGNIQRVDRLAADDLALFSFTPGRGVSGMQVRLQGSGFSAAPGANTVRFGTVSATVTQASTSELTVLVPAGAITAPISISVGGQSISSTDFVVDQSSGQPSIHSIAPQLVSAGTHVTITGESLYPIEYQTTVRIGSRSGLVGSAAQGLLDFVVPTAAASGKVSVSTPYGMAVSAQDLVILPTGVSAASVSSFRRIVPDAAASSFSVDATGQQVAVLVDAALGEHLDVQFSAISAGSLGYTLYDPANRRLISGTVSSASPTALLPPAASAGTYLLLIKPSAAPVTWAMAIDRSRALVVGAAPLSVGTIIPGQKKRLVFPASVGQWLGLGVSDLSLSAGTSMSVSAVKRDTTLTSTTCYASNAGCQLNIRPTQVRSHAVVFSSAATQTFQTQVTLSDDLNVDLQREVPFDVIVPRRGQNARLYFQAQAGESLALQIASQLTLPAGKSVSYGIYKPDGTLLKSATATTHKVFNLPTMPQTGTYYVFVDPDHGATSEARILLREGSGNGGEMDGDPGEFATETGGESVYFNFEVSELDERVGVGISDLVLSSGTYVNATLYRPDGTSAASTTCSQSRGGCGLNLRAPMVGRYSVLVQPVNATQIMSLKGTVSRDIQLNMEYEQPVELTLGRRGQNGRLYFDAEEGANLAVLIGAQLTTPANRSVNYGVYTEAHVQVASLGTDTLDVLRLNNLAAGRYYLYVDPADGAQAQALITLSAGQNIGLVVDGEPAEHVAPVPGFPAFITFTTTEVEQRLGLALHDIVLDAGTSVSAQLYGPAGQSLGSSTCVASRGCEINIRAAVPGTYSLVVRPQAGQLMQFLVTVSNDLTLDLQREVPLALDLARHGQNAWLSFDAQAGETLGLQISGQATLPAGNVVTYQVIRPDGVSLVSRTPITHDSLNLPTLPMGGIYQVFVDPRYGATVSTQLRLTDGSESGTRVDGEPVELSTTQPGQPTYLTFQATAGERLGLGISDLVLSTGSNVVIYVYRPGGATAGNLTCTASNGGCAFAFTPTDTGTYSVVAMPQTAAQTHAFKFTLSRELEMQLERDTPIDVRIARRGQKVRLRFAGQAGEALALQLAAQATVPAGRTVAYRIYRPDGTALGTVSTAAYGSLDLRLPADGTYQILVDPPYGETISARMTLASGARPSFGDVPVDVQTALGGQPAYATFQAISGQRLSVGIHDLVLSSGTSVAVTVSRPDGTSAGTATCMQANQGCKVNLPVAMDGTYSVAVVPQAAGQTMTFKLSVSEDLTGVLLPDQPLDLVIPRRGQNARLTFNGQAGQVLSLQIAGQTTVPATRTVHYRVYKPDGALLTSTSTTAAEALRLAALPADGAYSVLVDSGQGEILQARLTLATGSSLLAVDGASADIATAIGGQEVFLTFEASAGQRLGIGLDELQLSSGTYFSATLYRPDGGSANATCYVQYGGCELNATSAVAGVYRLYMKPQTASQRMQFKATVSTDLEVALDKAVPVQLALNRRGRNGALAFAGLSGESLKLQINEQLTAPSGGSINYVVYRPDGSSLTSVTTSTPRAIQLPVLPVNGTYRVMVSPTYGATADIGVVLQ
jgi:large repetitive protein